MIDLREQMSDDHVPNGFKEKKNNVMQLALDKSDL